MKRISVFLVSGMILSAMIPAFSRAEQMPASGAYDSRMRYVGYNPGQVVHLSTVVGATMVVTFGATETVTSVAETDSGQNTFRVEAMLNAAPDRLRPGMEGIGKIDVGTHSYAWVWTRSLMDWARMLIWSWTP